MFPIEIYIFFSYVLSSCTDSIVFPLSLLPQHLFQLMVPERTISSSGFDLLYYIGSFVPNPRVCVRFFIEERIQTGFESIT